MIIHNPPNDPAEYTILWLHGLGADSSDFAPIVPELQLPEALPIRFIFPNAPLRPVTINNGYVMRAWYDIYGISIDTKIDEAGITDSVAAIHHLIAQEEANGITSQHILIAGFSQGAVIALHAGLRYNKPLGGIIALSGYLPLAPQLWQQTAACNQTLPIFIAHGTEDTVVPYALGKASYAALKDAGYAADWHSYPMPHSVCAQEVKDISLWIQKVMSEQSVSE